MKSKRGFSLVLVILLASALVAPSKISGQTTYGSIVGSVTDNTGAMIPAATVTLTHLGTNESQTVQSSATGLYQFLQLHPANYRIEVEVPGFKRSVREPIGLEMSQVVRIDASMELGEVTESIEVTGATPLLESETSTLGEVINERKVIDLPLNGRNPFGLMSLVPGVIPGGCDSPDACHPAVINFTGWGNYQIGGTLANQSEALWDGAPLTGGQLNGWRFVPTQDAVQEFKVQTNNYGAEFGRTAGGMINITTKSGSNEFHGSLFEFLRNKAVNTNNYFAKQAGLDKPPYTQNQYGGTVGGPILKDKVFFFTSWESARIRRAISLVHTVATAQQRMGDFSQTFVASGSLIPVYDPNTSREDPNARGSYIRDPFVNNTVPSNRLSPTAQVMKDLFGQPNVPGEPVTNINNFFTNASVADDSDQFNGRLDYLLSDNHKLFGRYTWYQVQGPGIDTFGTGVTTVDFGPIEDSRSKQALLDSTYTINPTTVLNLRYSLMRFLFDRSPLSFGTDLARYGGGWGAINDQVGERLRHHPVLRMQDMTSIDASSGSTIYQRESNHQVVGSLSKFTGKHTFKFGGELRIIQLNYAQSNSTSGDFTFNNILTANTPSTGASGGFGWASFMLGLPNNGNLWTPGFAASQRVYRGLYFQDDYRATNKLTFNLGVRYDIEGPWTERFDRIAVFQPTEPHPLGSDVGLDLKGRLALVGSPERASRGMRDTFYGQFAPRMGLAYRLADRTVIRTGYGIFFLPGNIGRYEPSLDPLSSIQTPMVGSLDGGVTPGSTIDNPFPTGLLVPPGREGDFQKQFTGLGPFAEYGEASDGYTQHWNFNLQHTLPGEWLIDVAYAGSKGTALPLVLYQANSIPNEFLSLGPELNEQVANPFFGSELITPGPLTQPTLARGQLLRPFPQYTSVLRWDPPVGSSIYHSAQVKAEKRFSNGASILASYTNAKLISDVETITGWLQPSPGVQNPQNLRAERSVSGHDIAQRFVLSTTLDVPVGRGRGLGGNVTGFADKLISGWAINAIYTAQSGFPLGGPGCRANLTGSFGGGCRVNSTGSSAGRSGNAEGRINEWFDTSKFTQPSAFTFGNVARTLPDVRTHGVHNLDFSFFKNTLFGPESRYNVQFRVEFFNIFDRTQFGFPNLASGSTAFGVITDQLNEPRIIQFGLKFMF